ncbi:MAG: exosome complex RNA-binding protein Csl4 [Promethearchaeota archaeon]
MSETEKEKIVVPGDYLGVIEEFIPGPGTFESGDGKIYSNLTGKKIIDKVNLEVRVVPFKDKDESVPKPGDIVVCEVVFARKQSVATNIFKLNSEFLFNTFRGTLHVSKMSENYLKTVGEGFRPTDIIRARIVERNFNEYELSTRGSNLGVVYAECVLCGHELIKSGNRLECPRCRYPNPRKFAKDYGRVREHIKNLI